MAFVMPLLRFPRSCWLLLAPLAVLAFSAMDASAYDLAAGRYHTCAIDDNGVICWGHNDYGKATVPANLANPSAIAGGYHHTCALDDNGVTCWGRNNEGQTSVPASLVNPSAIALGGAHTCAIDDSGVICWGG